MERKEAIEIVRKLYNDSLFLKKDKEAMVTLIPELAESEDERIRKDIISLVIKWWKDDGEVESKFSSKNSMLDWLEKRGEPTDIPADAVLDSNKDGLIADNIKTKGEQKPAEWSEEDETCMTNIIIMLKEGASLHFNKKDITKAVDWLKYRLNSLRPQKQWKPSNEMLEALYRVIPENVMEKSEDEILLDKLYQGLKYGKVINEN